MHQSIFADSLRVAVVKQLSPTAIYGTYLNRMALLTPPKKTATSPNESV